MHFGPRGERSEIQGKPDAFEFIYQGFVQEL